MSRLGKACEAIEKAQEAVAEATLSYSKGGSLDAVNSANRDLADAHLNYQQVSGGNAPRNSR